MNKIRLSAFCLVFLVLTAIVRAGSIPDTGQIKCYNNTAEIPCPSPGQPFYGQDANFTLHPKSYTKLDKTGNALPDDAPSWVMVKDNVSGLIWEMKTNMDGINNFKDPHDADNTYYWYDSDADSHGAAEANGDIPDTEGFIKALNSARYGGYSDWRMPTIKELGSIVNFGIPYPGPTIDTDYFPNTQPSFYWSATTYAYFTSFVWGVYFSHGHDDFYSDYFEFYVRAVRGGPSESFFDPDSAGISPSTSTGDNFYVDNNNGTVTDTHTGLMWQQETPDILLTWEQALSYCENLSLAGFTDWRLPTIEELRSIADFSHYKPAISTTFFPDTSMSFYWSATTYTTITNNAWGIYFNYGYNHYDVNKSSPSFIRAVRSLGESVLASNSIGTRNTIRISDLSGTLPVGGGEIYVFAWDVSGNALPEPCGTSPLTLFNHGTTRISGSDLAARYLNGIPLLYKFFIESSKVAITNEKNATNAAFKVPIVYLNGMAHFVSNSIGNDNTIKISDLSGLMTSGGLINVLAWDENGVAIPESERAAPLTLHNHGTTQLSGYDLAERFPTGSPMTYEFDIPSSKLLVTNDKRSTDGSLIIPVIYTHGVNNFVSNAIDKDNTLVISDLSGLLALGGIPITVKAWDEAGNLLPGSEFAPPLTLYNHGTTRISGANLVERFPAGTPITYEFSVESSKVLITNVKRTMNDFVEISNIFTSGVSNFSTNHVNSLDTIKISDTSGTLPAAGVSITFKAWDAHGNEVLESAGASPLKLYNHGTTAFEGKDLLGRFSTGAPKLYELFIGSSDAIVTTLTTSVDGTIKIPSVFTIGTCGGI